MTEFVLDPIEVETRLQRAYNAYKDRLAGDSWLAIASNYHYKTPGGAKAEVTNLINAANEVIDAEYKEEVTQMELERLDAMQKSIWDSAESGDLKAIETVLKIMNHRAKLTRIGELDETDGKTQTIIISEADYVTRLKEISDGKNG